MAIRPMHALGACIHLSCGEGTAHCSLTTERIEPKSAPCLSFFVFSVSFVVRVFLEFAAVAAKAGGQPPETCHCRVSSGIHAT